LPVSGKSESLMQVTSTATFMRALRIKTFQCVGRRRYYEGLVQVNALPARRFLRFNGAGSGAGSG
jgi:hypothetical protein